MLIFRKLIHTLYLQISIICFQISVLLSFILFGKSPTIELTIDDDAYILVILILIVSKCHSLLDTAYVGALSKKE